MYSFLQKLVSRPKLDIGYSGDDFQLYKLKLWLKLSDMSAEKVLQNQILFTNRVYLYCNTS